MFPLKSDQRPHNLIPGISLFIFFLLYAELRYLIHQSRERASAAKWLTMTQLGGPNGPSTQAPLPVRPAPSGPATTNKHNNQRLQIAVSEGKDISESLANILKRSSLADNEQSNLHQVVSLAEELQNYQFPAEFTVGLVGDSGVGKYCYTKPHVRGPLI